MRHMINLSFLTAMVLFAFLNVGAQSPADESKKFRALEEKWREIIKTSPYRTTIETFINNETTSSEKRTTELVPPDRDRTLWTVKTEKGVREYEVINIGNKMFVRDKGGKWTIPELSGEGVSKYGIGSQSVKFIEKTTLDGKVVNIWESNWTDYPDGEPSRSGKTRDWYSDDGHLLRSEKTTRADENGHPSKIITTYEYDPNIKIEAPILTEK